MNVETGFGCAAFVLRLSKAGQRNERERLMAIGVAYLLGHLVTIQSGHPNVQHGDFRSKLLDSRQRTRSVTGRRDGVAFALQEIPHHFASVLVVVRDQDPKSTRGGHGRRCLSIVSCGLR